MSRIGTRIATIAATAGGLATAFLALSPAAAADPAAPAVPAAPGGINVIQQLANAPALASQMLQSAATMLQPAPAASAIAAAPAAPAGPAPTASASLNLPQPPLSAPMTSAVGTIPGAPANPAATAALPLLSQLGLPSTLNGLGGLPLPNLGAPAAAPAVPAAPGQPALPPNLNPFSALP